MTKQFEFELTGIQDEEDVLYLIALPSEWVETNGLKFGDKIKMRIEDKELILSKK